MFKGFWPQAQAACVLGLMASLLWACGERTPSYARRAANQQDLVGGPGAIGAVGDYLLGNGEIRVVVQDQGWSRGFGVFGGGLVDADRIGGAPGEGRDNFGEFFPALLMQGFDVRDQSIEVDGETQISPAMEVIADGSDGGPAIVRARASGGDFLTMLSTLSSLGAVGGDLRYETDYVLHPGARYVEIIGRLHNAGSKAVDLSAGGLEGLLGVADMQLPLGDVLLFGGGNRVFAPGSILRSPNQDVDPRLSERRPVGFDLRFAVEDAYAKAVSLPALVGLVTDFMATTGKDVSYGFAVAPSPRNYVWLNRDQYGATSDDQLVIPFLISSFTGAYHHVPPELLAPGESFLYRRYFIVGDGDVASIRDTLFDLRQTATGVLAGEVRRGLDGVPEVGASVLILDAAGDPYSQVRVRDDGRFRCRLEPGRYGIKVLAEGRSPWTWRQDAADPTAVASGDGVVEITANEAQSVRLFLPSPAQLAVRVQDGAGQPLPAKVTVLASYDASWSGLPPRTFLFDASLGEERRGTDLSWQEDLSQTLPPRFIEEVFFTDATGVGDAMVRPSPCVGPVGQKEVEDCVVDIVVSRGPEYSLAKIEGVRLEAGKIHRMDVVLHRVVQTPHRVSADFHIHAQPSLDASMPLEKRVASGAAEGLEIAVATDHNVVTDYAPAIAALKLTPWMRGVRGVELSTLEMGHFNGFPLDYDLSSATRFPWVAHCFEDEAQRVNQTGFDWVSCAPKALFDNLRRLGHPDEPDVVVQVNHPRDGILGYFDAFNVDGYVAEAKPAAFEDGLQASLFRPQNPTTRQFEPSKFSLDFDAIEIFNGKRLDLVRHYRLPLDTPADLLAEVQDPCLGGHPSNARGEILHQRSGSVAEPGALDDWFNLLNLGHRFTATGNSDSHDLEEEIGYPRNYLSLRTDEGEALDASRQTAPQEVSLKQMVDAVRAARVLVTNGPFVTFWIQTEDGRRADLGETLHAGDLRGKTLTVHAALEAADWVDVDRVRLTVNGVAQDVLIPDWRMESVDASADVYVKKWDAVWSFDIPTAGASADFWFVVEAEGDDSLFPVVRAMEVPPVSADQVIQGFAGALGLAAADPSKTKFLEPSIVQQAKPYALTNPIWLDGDGDGVWTPPGVQAGPASTGDVRCDTTAQKGNAAKSVKAHNISQAERMKRAWMQPSGEHSANLRSLFLGHAH